MFSNTMKLLSRFLVMVFLAGCSLLPQPGSSAASGSNGASGAITASGTIQVDSIRLASQVAGKILAVNVKQGDQVQAGQVLFRLDDSALQTQRNQAAAGLQAAQAAQAAAQADLALLQAGATEAQTRASQAQLDQADASLKAAQAALRDITAGTRPEDISAAQARVDLARAGYYNLTDALSAAQVDAARVVLNRAQETVSQMQDRRDRLAQDKRTPPDALEAARRAIADAQTTAAYAKQASDLAEDTGQPLYLQIAAVKKTWEAAQLALTQGQARLTALRAEADMPQDAVNAAQSAVTDSQNLADQAKKAYDALNTGSQADQLKTAWDAVQNAQRDFDALANAQALGAAPGGAPNLETLLNQLNAVSAQRDAAQASFDGLKAGPRLEQVRAAQAQLDAAKAKVTAAQAALDAIDVEMKELVVSAPSGGIILNQALYPGEIASAGATVVEMGSLDQVTLKVYVPEDQYGRIKLGQSVAVRVDSFPGRTFAGSVTNISNQAEFTPRNVQTQETRSTTVYAIEIHLSNPDHALKPGMPADTTF